MTKEEMQDQLEFYETRRAWRRLCAAWFDVLSAIAEDYASRWSARRDNYL